MESRIDSLNKLPEESFEEYFIRICENRERFGLTYKKIAELLNEASGQNFGECAYRKRYTDMSRGINYARKHYLPEDTAQMMIDLQKERVKLQDERTAYRKMIRQEARKEAMLENMERVFSKNEHASMPFYMPYDIDSSDNAMVVLLSDWHIGLEIKDGNTVLYNVEVAKHRVAEYVRHIMECAKLYKPHKAYFVILGDMISGLCHASLRVASDIDIVEQIKTAADLVAFLINQTRGFFERCEVITVQGNHSRMSANKENATLGEYTDMLIPSFLNCYFTECDEVVVHIYKDKSTLAIFDVNGMTVAAVHGDYDPSTDAGIAKLKNYAGKHIDIVVRGHMHTNSYDELSDVEVIQSGNLAGSGCNYTERRRLKGAASQMCFIVDGDARIRALLPIRF